MGLKNLLLLLCVLWGVIILSVATWDYFFFIPLVNDYRLYSTLSSTGNQKPAP